MFTIIIVVCAILAIVAGDGEVTGKDNIRGEQYLRRVKQDPLVVDKTCECKGQYVGQDFAVDSGGMTFLDIQDTVLTQSQDIVDLGASTTDHDGRLTGLEEDFSIQYERVTDLETSSTERMDNLEGSLDSRYNVLLSHIGIHNGKIENLQSYIRPFELNFEAHSERIDNLETSNTDRYAKIESLETCCTGHDVRMEVLEMKVNALQQGINICGPVGGGFGGYFTSSSIWERNLGDGNASPLDCVQECVRDWDGTIGMYMRFSWGAQCNCLGPYDSEGHPLHSLTCLAITSSRLEPSNSPYPEGTYYLLPNSFSNVCPSEEGLFGPGCV